MGPEQTANHPWQRSSVINSIKRLKMIMQQTNYMLMCERGEWISKSGRNR
jgi:hypothetical protein